MGDFIFYLYLLGTININAMTQVMSSILKLFLPSKKCILIFSQLFGKFASVKKLS